MLVIERAQEEPFLFVEQPSAHGFTRTLVFQQGLLAPAVLIVLQRVLHHL